MPKINISKNLIYIVFVLIILNLLFAGKAIHIDDSYTITATKSISQDILSPKGVSDNPPFIGYYYLPILKIFGESTVAYHIFSLPFVLLAVYSMLILSYRFTQKKLLPVMALIVTPAFLISAQSIRLDIPLFSLSLFSLALFIYGIDNKKLKLLFLSVFCAGVAILIKYSGLLLIPCMLVYALLFSKKRLCVYIALLPGLAFLLWGIFNFLSYGNFSFFQALLFRIENISARVIFARLLASLSFFSGSSLLLLFLVPFFLVKPKNRFIFLASVFLALFLLLRASYIFNEYYLYEKIILFIFFIASIFLIIFKGLLALTFIFKKSFDKEDVFLVFWFFLVFVFIVVTQFVPVRFILLLLPPAFIFIFRQLGKYGVLEKLIFKKTIYFSFFFTFSLSVFLACGNYYFAGIYRNFAYFLKEKNFYSEKIFFPLSFYQNHTVWGFSYYLNKLFPYEKFSLDKKITENSDVLDGAIVVLPLEPVLPVTWNLNSQEHLFDYKNHGFSKKLVKEVRYNSFVVLHHRGERTGFYSHDWGLLPFKISLRPLTIERFGIYRLEKTTNEKVVF